MIDHICWDRPHKDLERLRAQQSVAVELSPQHGALIGTSASRIARPWSGVRAILLWLPMNRCVSSRDRGMPDAVGSRSWCSDRPALSFFDHWHHEWHALLC